MGISCKEGTCSRGNQWIILWLSKGKNLNCVNVISSRKVRNLDNENSEFEAEGSLWGIFMEESNL